MHFVSSPKIPLFPLKSATGRFSCETGAEVCMSCRELYDSPHICCSKMRQAAEMYSFLCVFKKFDFDSI